MKKVFVIVFALVIFCSRDSTRADSIIFVSRNEVQAAFDSRSKEFRDNAESVQFRSQTSATFFWECFSPATNTTFDQQNISWTAEGIVSSIAYRKKQIVGFNLEGLTGNFESFSDGPEVNVCPEGTTYVEGSTLVAEDFGRVQVSVDGIHWQSLTENFFFP